MLVPGAGYKVESPLLFWPAEQLKDRGWQVHGIRWTEDDEPGDDPHGFAAHSLQVPNDWRASLSAQVQAFTAVESFLAG